MFFKGIYLDCRETNIIITPVRVDVEQDFTVVDTQDGDELASEHSEMVKEHEL